jgi:hypothetical protein
MRRAVGAGSDSSGDAHLTWVIRQPASGLAAVARVSRRSCRACPTARSNVSRSMPSTADSDSSQYADGRRRPPSHREISCLLTVAIRADAHRWRARAACDRPRRRRAAAIIGPGAVVTTAPTVQVRVVTVIVDVDVIDVVIGSSTSTSWPCLPTHPETRMRQIPNACSNGPLGWPLRATAHRGWLTPSPDAPDGSRRDRDTVRPH